jgi:hypothetical protein
MNLNTDGLKGCIHIGPRVAEDWRECAIAVRAGGFSAECTCFIREIELHQLLRQLESAVSRLGQARDIDFRTLERGITFTIRLDQRGHVEGKYEFGPDWRGPFLSGSFSADQTHLCAWAKELKVALQS